MKKLIDFIYNLDCRPAYVEKDCIEVRYDNRQIDIVLFESYFITFDLEYEHNDNIYNGGSGAWGKELIEYALEILNNREYIINKFKKSLTNR